MLLPRLGGLQMSATRGLASETDRPTGWSFLLRISPGARPGLPSTGSKGLHVVACCMVTCGWPLWCWMRVFLMISWFVQQIDQVYLRGIPNCRNSDRSTSLVWGLEVALTSCTLIPAYSLLHPLTTLLLVVTFNAHERYCRGIS